MKNSLGYGLPGMSFCIERREQLFAFGFYRLKSIKRKNKSNVLPEGPATKSMTGKPGRRDGARSSLKCVMPTEPVILGYEGYPNFYYF